MPTTPYAKLLASVNGGTPLNAPFIANPADVIQLVPESTIGWGSPATRYEITAFPPGWPAPTGWTFDPVNLLYYYYAGGAYGTNPPPITMPTSLQIAGGIWGKWKFRLLVKGGGGNLTDWALACRIDSSTGIQDVANAEGTEFGGVLRWVAALQHDLRALDAAIAGGVGGGVSLGSGSFKSVNAAAPSASSQVTAAPFDHGHQVLVDVPVTVGTSLAGGTSTSLARADHVHTLPWATVVSVFSAATTALGMNGQRLTGLGTPTASSDAVPKSYADALVTFATVNAALAAANAPININGVRLTGLGVPNPTSSDAATTAYVDAAVAATVRTVRGASLGNQSLSGALTEDGLTYATNDLYLAKNQTDGTTNGIYVVSTTGAWSRAANFSTSTQVVSGILIFVLAGTSQRDTGWALTTTGTIVVGTTNLTFQQVFGQVLAAGNGIDGGALASGSITVKVGGDGSLAFVTGSLEVGVLATDAQHGSRGNGALHAVATGSAAGFMPAAMWSLVNGATVVATPSTLAARGTSGESSFAYLYPGGTVASSGFVRLPAVATAVAFREAANTGDFIAMALDGANGLSIGDATFGSGYVTFNCHASSFLFKSSGTEVFAVDPSSGVIRYGIATRTWVSAVTNPTITQAQPAGIGATSGQPMLVQAQQGQAQSGGAANNNGGALTIAGGGPGTGGGGAAGVQGALHLQGGGALLDLLASGLQLFGGSFAGVTATKTVALGTPSLAPTTPPAGTLLAWADPTDGLFHTLDGNGDNYALGPSANLRRYTATDASDIHVFKLTDGGVWADTGSGSHFSLSNVDGSITTAAGFFGDCADNGISRASIGPSYPSGVLYGGEGSGTELTPPFTVSLWFNQSFNGGGAFTMFGRSSDTNYSVSADKSVGLWMNGNEIVASMVFGSGAVTLGSNINVSPGTGWHHVGMTYDATTWNLYFDGDLIATRAQTGGIVWIANNGWAVGGITGHGWSGTVSAEHLQGKFADVRMATVIRNAAWFKAVYQNAVGHLAP